MKSLVIASTFLSLASAYPLSPLYSLWRRASNDTCDSMSYEGDSDLAVSIPSGTPLMYLVAPLVGDHEINKSNESFSGETFCNVQNDTSIFVINDGSTVSFTDVNMTKFGYTSDLNQASFFGLNAMVNLQNNSHVTASHTNLTSHNGNAGWFSWGDGTTLNISDSHFSATGPTSHGLYAAGNGSIAAHRFTCETFGYRSSCLSGDTPAGNLYIYDSQVKMWGLGSAVAYTVGSTYLKNVTGYSYQAFAIIADGAQSIDIHDSDIEGGKNFATVTLFGSQGDLMSSSLKLSNTHLRSHGDDHPIFGFANIIGNVTATNLTVTSESGILAVSNSTGISQKFDHWRNAAEGAAGNPATGSLYIKESDIKGSIKAINGSSILFSLESSSSWSGSAEEDSSENEAFIGIILDSSSTWNVTADSSIHNLTVADNDLSSIKSNGHTITYSSSSSANTWLNGTTHSLTGGGTLQPSS